MSVQVASELELRITQEASEHGIGVLGRVVGEAAALLERLSWQLRDGDTARGSAVEKSHSRDLVEALIESLETDLPVNPADLVADRDPEDELLGRAEYAADAVRQAMISALSGLRYEQ